MFSPICSICSELLSNEEVVSTRCGHVFHRECLTEWLTSSRTCPTCRCAATSTTLIKLFFTFDDQKANFQLEEILKTNDELTQNSKEFQDKSTKLEIELREVKEKFKELTASEAMLKRQKQLDDMTIAGISGIKNESTKEIIKLNQTVTALKLDLLAEKQLRRIHQKSLHELKPDDINYDVKSIDVPDSSSTVAEAPKNPYQTFGFHTIAPTQPQSKDTKPYVIPSKIQKSNDDSKARSLSFNMKASILRNKGENKPVGFQFQDPSSSSSAYLHSQPSSYSASMQPAMVFNDLSKHNKRSFGEGFVFNQPNIIQAPFEPNYGINFSGFSNNSPTFQFSTTTPSSRVISDSIISRPHNYREPSESLPSTSSDQNRNGPKTSDR